ncbi:MAG: hypothetical protein WC128_09030 [Bacteroidales bacterium]|jgi:hypothetical protein
MRHHAMRNLFDANAALFQKLESVELGMLTKKKETYAQLDTILNKMVELEPPMMPELQFGTDCVWDA